MVVNEKEGIKKERNGKREETEVGRKKELKKLGGRCEVRKEGAGGRKEGAGGRKEGAEGGRKVQ